MIGRLLETRASITVGRDGWIIVKGKPTKAGPAVDEETSLSLPAVFRAVDTLSGHLAMLPLPVIERTGKKTRERRPEHPVHSLLNLTPDPEDCEVTSMAFRQALTLHKILWGTGRALIEREPTGEPRKLSLLHPDRTETKRNLVSKELVHLWRDDDGIEHVFRDADVIRVPSLSADGILGFGLIHNLARENIGLGLAITEYAQRFFGHNTQLGTIITAKAVMGPEKRKEWKEQFDATHQGSDKAFGTMLADGDVDVKRLGTGNEQAQMIETMTFAVQDVARWTNLTPPFLMELSRATFSNITELGRWHVIFSLSPWFVRDEQEFTLKLFSKEERKTYTVKYNPDALVRGDIEKRMKAHVQALTNGIRNIDEVRELEDLNPLPDGLGQEYRVQAQMTTLGEEPEESEPPPALPPMLPGQNDEEPNEEEEARAELQTTIRAAHIPLLADVIERMLKVELTARDRALAKPDTFDAWAEKFYAEHELTFRRAIIPVVDALAFLVRGTVPCVIWQRQWDQFTVDAAAKATDSHINESRHLDPLPSSKLGEACANERATREATFLVDYFITNANAMEPDGWDSLKN